MRTASTLVIAAAFLTLTPAVGSAQDRRVHVNLGGGPTFIMGDLGESFSTGWGPAVGITFDAPNGRLGFQFEYAYRWFNVNDELPIGATRFSANHVMNQLDFNLVANLTPPAAPFRGYVLAGPGVYHRKVEITEYVGNGVICGWYVCGVYPVTDVIGSRGGWDFGFNIGGGIGFPIGEGSEFFIETRYHYVAGPDPEPTATPLADTTGSSTTGHYWPLTFGFRF